MSQIIIGMSTEGTTDTRLLESILTRTFESVGSECSKQIEIVDPIINLKREAGRGFVDQMVLCCETAFNWGIMALCIHVDADASSNQNAINYKINPLNQHINASGNDRLCKNLVPVIPVHMSEAWMLADVELLKDEIGTEKSNFELGLHRAPESYSDPKSAIVNAIQLARANGGRNRRNDLDISDLYQSIGQKVPLDKLEHLASYANFKEHVRNAYRYLNYMQ